MSTPHSHPMQPVIITMSVVSHRQNALVNQLLADIERQCAGRVAVTITENVPDSVALATESLSCPVERIVNDAVKGFGANHNAAFRRCKTPYFCVANPDIRLTSDPFPYLLTAFDSPQVAVSGPLVRNPAGAIEDSARRFPTVADLIRKLFGAGSSPEYPADGGAVEAHWIAGMFMLFRSDDFRDVGGFDEAYFLYWEDVDLCWRLGQRGRKVIYEPRAEVIHDARRGSRRNPRLALHHAASMVRFFTGR